MKRNLTCGLLLVVIVSLVAVYALRQKPKDETHAIGRAREIMRDVFHFETTNEWCDVKASGGVTVSVMGRKRNEYFLVQRSELRALDEIQTKYGSRNEGYDVGNFSYWTNYDPSRWRIEGRALKLAPWWNEENQHPCTLIRLGTNLLGSTWSARLFAYSRGTNTVLYTHISENVE